MIETSLPDHDPQAVECRSCHKKREFAGREPLRRAVLRKSLASLLPAS
ncbi:hypothetical protein [Kitasatospora sp. NPDC007106]